MITKPTLLPDLAKSYGRKVSHNEEITSVKHWQAEKTKRVVTDKFSKRGWWRLKPQRNLEVTFVDPVEQLAERREKPSSSNTKDLVTVQL